MTSDYSAAYDPDLDFDRWYTTLTARRMVPKLPAGCRVLEVGSATGLLTEAIAGDQRSIVCVERSAAYVQKAQARGLAGVRIEQCTIEDFACDQTFDHVLAINVLHEVSDQCAVVKRLTHFMGPDACLHVTLPNPLSLHRLSAYGSGLIGYLCEISARGQQYETRRLQYADEFAALMATLDLVEVAREAVLIKPLPNAAMEQLSNELIEAYDELGVALPEHGAMTYFVFRRVHG